jgi:ABC-2 type transport system ATP-binding protein
MGRRDIAARFDDIVDFSGLGSFIESPVKTYSSGMYIRLAFAVAINVDPRLLIIDEILAVGDVSFQQRCLEKFVEFRNEGRTILLVTHDLGTVKDMCDRAIWLTHGKITGEGDPSDLVEEYTESMLGNRDRYADGSIRRGSGQIQITKVQLFTGDGLSPVKRFRTGDSVRIRMTYSAMKPVPKPVIGITIEALGGATVTAPCTRDVGMIPEALSGEGTIEVEFDAVSLLPGTYDLHTSITDFNRSHVYDNLHLAFRFDVMSGKPYESDGIVTLRPQWTID